MTTNPNPKFPSASLQKAELEKVFKRIDKNGDGKISISELGDMMQALGTKTSSEELNRMMTEFDTDGDGFIDLREFEDIHGDSGNDMTDGGQLKDAFSIYDLDKNGLISPKELHMVLKKLGEKCSLADCSRMISSVDADGDGSINFDEFKKMMSNSGSKPSR